MGHDKTSLQLPAQCLNCSAVLTGNYCSHCGQSARVGVPTLAELAHDFTEAFFHLDSSFWRTLKTLLLSPGKLTTCYTAGERARYMPPFKLYVLVSVVYFFAVSVFSDATPHFTVELGDGHKTEVRTNGEHDCGMDQQVLDGMWGGNVLRRACARNEASGGTLFDGLFRKYVPVTLLMTIPFTAILLKLVYWTSSRRYVEHVVFGFHMSTTYFAYKTVSLAVGFLAPWLGSLGVVARGVALLLFLAPFLLLFPALKRHYGGSTATAIGKGIVILLAYAVIYVMAWLAEGVLIAIGTGLG